MKNWDPGQGGMDPDSKRSKFFSTEAHDGPDVMNTTNEQKEFVGKNGTPKGPFGKQGKEF